jgi:hypothetical protein
MSGAMHVMHSAYLIAVQLVERVVLLLGMYDVPVVLAAAQAMMQQMHRQV